MHAVDAAPGDAIAATGIEGVWLRVRPSEAAKCVRCWHHTPAVGTIAGHPELCDRCVTNLAEPGETRRYA